MFEIKVISNFSAAHRLRNYKGKCEKLHGHNWRVESCISCAELDKAGMTIDFQDLKKNLNKVLKTLDHNYLNEIKPFKNINPTSENIAKFIFEQLSGLPVDKRCKLKLISVWETETS